MNTLSTLPQIPHVDVVERDIDPLLADSANFVLDAVECEDINEWVPDLGMTEYPVRSIYRPAALAASGMVTTLRHRFWDTLRGMSDHTGDRYLGLVIYAAAGEECPFELRLGAEQIGRVEPARGAPDLRRAPAPRSALRARHGPPRLDGKPALPVQTRILSRWADGSSRWLLVDTTLPASSESKPSPSGGTLALHAAAATKQTDREAEHPLVASGARLRVRVGTAPAAAAPQDGIPIRIEGRSGEEWLPLLGGPARLEVVLGSGVTLANGPLEDLALEEAGPQRWVIRFRVPHLDRAGTPHLRSTIRIHLYAELSLIKLVHRLEVVSEALPRAAGGTVDELGADQELLRDNLGGSEGEQATLLALRSVSLTFPAVRMEAVTLNGERFGLARGAFRVAHEHAEGHAVVHAGERRERDGRSRGHLLAATASGTLGLAVRRFWETYPKGIGVAADQVRFELLPPLTGAPLPGDADAWHRLYSWHRDGRYLLKVGLAVTTEVALAAAADAAAAADLLAVFEEPPVARPALAWFNASGVWGVLAAKADSPFPRYERMVDQAYGEWLKEREQWQQYGFHNFGDYYGEMGWAWGNNEYDPAFAHLLEFLRGGRPGWAELAAQACRHLIDVDTVNFSREPREVGGQYAHMAGHSGGYLPPYFRYKMKGSTLIPSHMWVEGAVLHYCLTGDENVRETLLRTGEWLLGGGMRESGGGIDAYDFRTCREAGWHLIHLTGMARLADDPRFLNAAFIIVDRVLQRQEPEGGWMRNLKSGHCGCPIPRHRGEASFMVGIMMNGLRRVHQLTGDRRLEDAITGAARWLLTHTWDSAEGLFRYTPCPNLGTHGTSAGNTLQVIEGLGYAYRLTGDAAIGETILAALPHLAQPRLATTPDEVSAIGNRLCSETRSMPSFLADTQELIDHRPATI